MSDLITREDAKDAALTFIVEYCGAAFDEDMQKMLCERFDDLPSAEPERLTDDDFETIRIHLNAFKEKLCNQRRWKEADEYQRIIDRFMAFASAEPKRKTGKWLETEFLKLRECSCCGARWGVYSIEEFQYCPTCGARMDG